MVYLSARALLSVVYLSSYASYYTVSAICCPEDKTCSGCWMCPHSPLRTCWDLSTAEIDACKSIVDVRERLSCECPSYSKLAFCWSHGRCCTEYSPTLAAATNLCNLLTYPAHQLNLNLVLKAEEDANNVRNKIYHNDRGYDVPKLGIYAKVYSGSSEPSSYHPIRPSLKNDNPGDSPEAPKSDAASEAPNSKTYARRKSKPQSSSLDSDGGGASKPESITPLQNTSKSIVSSAVYKPTSPQSSSPGKVHHRAKCARHQHKCQSAIASQYHEARHHTSTRHVHGKRGATPLLPRHISHPPNAEFWKRSEKSGGGCGIDFQGVAYPSQVPPTVAKIFAEL